MLKVKEKRYFNGKIFVFSEKEKKQKGTKTIVKKFLYFFGNSIYVYKM